MNEESPEMESENNMGRAVVEPPLVEVAAVLPTGDLDQPRQGWVLQVPDNKQAAPARNEKVFEILVDSGAYTHVAPLDFAEHIPRDTSEEIFAYGPDGRRLRSYGVARVPLYLGDVLCLVPFVIMNVQKVIVSVGRLCSAGCTVNFSPTGTSISKDGQSVPVRKMGQLYLAKARFAPAGAMRGRHLVAPVEEEPVQVPVRAEAVRGEEDGEGEVRRGQEARAPGVPRKPGEEEVRKHGLTHVPYAAWCESCVRGRGREAPHRRREEAGEEQAEEIQLDYFFANLKSEEGTPGELKHLAVYAPRYGYGAATTINTKGASDAYAKAFVKGFLDEVGFHGDLLIQTDSEPPIRDFARAVAQQRTARTLLRTTGVGSHQANGGVERWIQSVCGLARTLRADLEGNYGVSVQSGSVLVPWMIRHAGWLLSRYGQDGERRTPHQKVHKQAYQGEVVNFGETVLGKECTSERGPKLEDGFVRGVWLGRATHGGEHLLGTQEGVVRCRTIKRRAAEESFDLQTLLVMRGAPWNVHGGRTVEDCRQLDQESKPTVRGVGKFAQDFRRFQQDVGPTEGCSGCLYPARGYHHNLACKMRRESWLRQLERTADETAGALGVILSAPATRAERQKEEAKPEAEKTIIAEKIVEKQVVPYQDKGSEVKGQVMAEQAEKEKRRAPQVDEEMDREAAKRLKQAERFLVQLERGDRAAERKRARSAPPSGAIHDQDSMMVEDKLEGAQASVRRRVGLVSDRHPTNHEDEAESGEGWWEPPEERLDDQKVEQLAKTWGFEKEALLQGLHRELQSLLDFGVYEEVPEEQSHGKEVVKVGVIFRNKDEQVKARIVAKDYAVTKRDDLWTATPSLAGVRTLLAVAAATRREVATADVSTAFLHVDLNREVYAVPPPVLRRPGKVWRLCKALYGLREAPKLFGEFLVEVLEEKMGCHRLRSDPQVFVAANGTHLAVYADDLVATGQKEQINQTWKELGRYVALKTGDFLNEET